MLTPRFALAVTIAALVVGTAWWSLDTASPGETGAQAAVRDSPRAAGADSRGLVGPLAATAGDARRAVNTPAEIATDGEPISPGPGLGPSEITGFCVLPPGLPRGTPIEVLLLNSEPIEPECVARTKADGKGAWRFDDLPKGSFRILARATSAGQTASACSPVLEARPGHVCAPVRLDLLEYVLSGRVLDPRGQPVAGLDVVVRSTPPVEFETMTSFTELEDGEIIISSISPTLPMIERAEDYGDLEPDQLLATTDLLFGVEDPVDAHEGWTRTDPSGRFAFRFTGPVLADIETSRARGQVRGDKPLFTPHQGSFELAPGGAAMEVTLKVAKWAGLVGAIHAPPGVSPTVDVFARRVGGSSTNHVTTEAGTGRFRFPDLSEGEWLLYGRAGGSQGQDYSLFRRMTLQGGRLTELNATLAPSSTLIGQVTTVDGTPVPGATVTAFGAENRNLKRSADTGPDGRFRIVGLYPCSYRLEVAGFTRAFPRTIGIGGSGVERDLGVLAVSPVAAEPD